MASPPSAAAAEELGSSPSEASPPPAQVSSPQGSSVSRIGKTPKVKPLKLGYLSFKEGNMLKKTFKPRFCILNKNNELEAYRDPNDQATGNKHATLSDLHLCDVVDIKDDKNDGFLFNLRINKQLHELCADTEQERTNWIVEIIKLRPVPYIIGLLEDGSLAYYAAFALGNLASHFDDARLRIVKEGGHLRLFNYLETSGKSDEGLHDMIYFAFSKMTALDENKEAMSMFITLFLQILNGSNERWKDFAVQALMHLSTAEANKIELKKQGGVKALLDVLTNEAAKDSWKEAAVAGLVNCATEPTVPLIVSEHLRALSQLLEHKNLKLAVKNACLSLLQLCLKNDKFFRAACDSPLIGSALSLSEDADHAVSEKALAIVALLSVDPQCRPRIVSHLNVIVQGLKSKSETVVEGHLMILLRLSADKQGCIELGKAERFLPLLQLLSSPELNRTVRTYAASTLLNITAVEEARVSLGRDASVLLALLDAVNKMSSSSGLDLFEKILAALVRLSECDAVKLTLVRTPGAIAALVALLANPVATVLLPLLGFVSLCSSHLCVRVELAANALEPLIKLVNSKNEKVQELGARVLCACAVPDAAAAAWRKVNLKDLTVLLTNKDTPLKTQAIVCRTFASLAALADLEGALVEAGVISDVMPLLSSSNIELKESAARLIRNLTSSASCKVFAKSIEKLIELLPLAKNELVEEALVQALCGCIRATDVSSDVLCKALPHVLALLQPQKGTRVAEVASMFLALAAADDLCAVQIFTTGFSAIVDSLPLRNDRVQSHLAAALSGCIKCSAVQKALLKEKGTPLVHLILSLLITSNLDVLEHALLSLRLLSVSPLKSALVQYAKRLASFLEFPSDAVQDYTAAILINCLLDEHSTLQLSASAGLQAVTSAIRASADAKLTGSWSLAFSASSSGVPGKLEVTAAPPINLTVSLANSEQRIGLARSIARALCPDDYKDGSERRSTRPSSAPDTTDNPREQLEEMRRHSAGHVRGSGIGSLWHTRQPRRLKVKRSLPKDLGSSNQTKFTQRQLSALAFYHSLQDPRLSRRFPRLCAYIRESCPKEREAKEELTLPRRVAHALDTSRLPELLTVERDPYVVSYAHTEPGTAAVIRAKQSVADDVTYAYFEVLVLDGGVQSTVALGLVPAESGANHMPGWRTHSYGYHGDDGNKFAGGVNAAYGPVFTTGDIVGCGVNNVTGQIFFTKNGMFLGYAFEKPATPVELFPAVGLASPNERVYINLGQAPFAWDFEVNTENTLVFTPAPKSDDTTPSPKSDTSDNPLLAAYEIHASVYSWMCASPLLASLLERNPSTMAAKLAASPAVPPLARPTKEGPACALCRLPIAGLPFVCSACENFSSCAECISLSLHPPQHLFIAVHNNADDSCNSKFQPVRFKSSGGVHSSTLCDSCNTQPIVGVRYEKLDLSGFSKYDLCEACHRALPVQFDANFLQVPAPLERDVLPQQKALTASNSGTNK